MNKTGGAAEVQAHIDAIADPLRRADCHALAALIQSAVGSAPDLWGAIVGYGGDARAPAVGFASRKDGMTLYLGPAVSGLQQRTAALGQARAGKGCVYLKRLADVDAAALRALVAESVDGR